MNVALPTFELRRAISTARSRVLRKRSRHNSSNGHEWGSLGAFTGGAKTTKSIMVGEILSLLRLNSLLSDVADEPVAKVLAARVRVTGGGRDLEDTFFNGKQGNIEYSMTPLYPSLPTKRISSPDLGEKYA